MAASRRMRSITVRLRANSGVPTDGFPRVNTALRSRGAITVEQVEGLTIDDPDTMFVDGHSSS